jgi:hypothetical protein
MTRARRIAAALAVFGCIAGAAGTSRAASLDPFRNGARSDRALDPFRVAQAMPIPPSEEPAKAKPAETKPTPSTPTAPTNTSTPPSNTNSNTSTAAPVSAAKACQKDEDCPEGNYCQANVCQKIELSTNLFPLYYHERNFTEVFLFYWSRSGNPGYRVVAPFYWHFWSPTSETFAIAPIYWHFTDSARQSELTVIIPFSWSHEPGASSFAIWPLFYASNKFGWAIPILLTFNVGDSKIGNQYGSFLGLYWWKRSQKGAFDFGFVPPYVSSRNADHAFTWAAPLNFYWRNLDDRNLLALPLFYKNSSKTGNAVYTWLGYSRREGREYSGTAFWLYWYGRDQQSHERYDVLFPLLWSFRGDTSKATVFFPLVWSFSTPKTNTTVVGPYIHRRNDTSYVDVLFPLWWSGGDDATGRGFKAFIPLFIWKSDAKARTATLITPAGGYTRDDAAGTRTGLIWPLLTYWSREPNSETNVVTPLYISHYSKTEHSMTRLATVFYQREDPQGTTTTLFPLFGYFHDTATNASALVTPLGGYRSGPRDTTGLFLTFYWRSYKQAGGGSVGWNAGLFPLFFFGQNKGTAHAIVFPLFWHLSTPETSTTAFVPLFYWHRDKKGYDFASLLFYKGDSGGESYAVQFPLFWHFASARRGTSTTYTPIGYYHTDPDGWSTGIGPIVPLLFARSGKTKSHFALVPLFWHFADRSEDKTTTVVLNYMHRTQGGETTDAFFPLLYYRRGAKPGGSDETSFTLFPLVHYRRDANTRVLATPLFASAKGPNRSGGFAGPYIWYDDKDLSLRFIPFLHIDLNRRDTGERTRQYGLWFQVDAPDRTARVLFPLWGTYTNPQETGTWVLPTFFRLRRNNGDRVDAFMPLYWRSSFGERHTLVVGPFYNRTAPGVHNYGFAPLFFRAENPERNITVIPPVLSYARTDRNGESAWQWTAVLYFHKHDKESSLSTLFPLYWSYKHGGHETAVGFPLYWHVADEHENRSWTYAFPVFWSSSGSWRTRGILTAWYTRDTAGEYSSHAFLPLFYQASAPDHFALLTPLAGYRKSGTSKAWYTLVPPILSTDSVQSSFSMVFPLFFRHTDKALERKTTVVPLGLFVSRTTPEESFTTAAALFWRYEDIASSTKIVLPLFYDVHDFHLSRTTVLFPLFVRHRNEVEQSTTWVSPFIYSHTTPTYGTTFGLPLVVLPLYWDIKRGSDETQLVFPLYARWKRQDYRSTLLIPFYYHQEGLRADGTPDGTYRRFIGAVVPFYDSGVKRLGDFNWNLLGGIVGGERIGHHNFFRLFWFFNFETSPAPRAQTAWYSAPAPTSRKVATRGLSVAGF